MWLSLQASWETSAWRGRLDGEVDLWDSASFIKTFIFNVIVTNKTHDFSFTFFKKNLKHTKTSLKDHYRNKNRYVN